MRHTMTLFHIPSKRRPWQKMGGASALALLALAAGCGGGTSDTLGNPPTVSNPVVVAGNDHWSGFRPDRIKSLGAVAATA